MSDIQNSNRTKISVVRESTFGVTPTSPAFKTRRVVSSGLAIKPQTVVSNEIRSDRQVADLILVGLDADGDLPMELSFKHSDDDIEEALQGSWSNNPLITVATLDTEISDVATAVVTVAAGGTAFVAGMLTLFSGFTTAANNKLAKVVSSLAASVTFPASTFTAEGAAIPVGATMRVVGFEGASGDLVAVTSGGNAITSTALDFTTLGLQVGEWLKVGDGDIVGDTFATAACNGWVRLSGIAAHALTFDRVPTGWTADAGTGKTVRVYMGDIVTNGTTQRSNTIERQYLNHSPVTYEYLRGLVLDTFVLDAPAQKVATVSLTYMGRDGAVQTSRVSGATDTAAPTYDVINTSGNVGRIALDGTAIAGPSYVTSAKFTIGNNLRRQTAVGALSAVGMGDGEMDVTLDLVSYFGDKSILDKIIANTATSFDMRLGRSDGNRESLLFDFPRIKYSAGAPPIPGKNQDVMINATAQALRDPTLGYTVAAERYWYLPAS